MFPNAYYPTGHYVRAYYPPVTSGGGGSVSVSVIGLSYYPSAYYARAHFPAVYYPGDVQSVVSLSGGSLSVTRSARTGKGKKREAFTDYRRAPNPKEVRASREDWGILPRAAEVIGSVAKRQAENLGLDAGRRTEELERELQAANIEWESRYLQALNVERERLITAEIGDRLKLVQDNRNAAVMLILLAL